MGGGALRARPASLSAALTEAKAAPSAAAASLQRKGPGMFLSVLLVVGFSSTSSCFSISVVVSLFVPAFVLAAARDLLRCVLCDATTTAGPLKGKFGAAKVSADVFTDMKERAASVPVPSPAPQGIALPWFFCFAGCFIVSLVYSLGLKRAVIRRYSLLMLFLYASM